VSSSLPISREWAVICESPRFSACLVGVEQLGSDVPSSRAGFEAVWTVEPDVVREALRSATSIACAAVPELAGPIESRLRQPPVVDQHVIRSMTSLTNRIFGYVDAPRRLRTSA
jgi:DICT domain-containing protein